MGNGRERARDAGANLAEFRRKGVKRGNGFKEEMRDGLGGRPRRGKIERER